MIKPDGVQRGLVGKIIERFENRGFQLVAMKLVHAGEDHLEKHYADLKGKPFFPGLIKYMSSGPVVAMVWQGKDVVKQGRALLGATNPLASAPGTIRGDLYVTWLTQRHRRRPQHLPRLGLDRVGPEGDCPLVRRAEPHDRVQARGRRVGLRVNVTIRST